MNYIDHFILERFTKLSHAFQWLTGRTNFFLAKLSRFAAFVSLFVTVANHFLKFLPEPTQAAPSWMVAFLIILMIATARDGRLCDDAEREFHQNRGGALPTSVLRLRHVSSFFFRMLFLYFVTISTALFFTVPHSVRYILLEYMDQAGFAASCFAFLYLVHVNPMPPCNGKAREWLFKLTNARVGELEEVRAQR